MLYLRNKAHGIHWIGGWMGRKAGLNMVGKKKSVSTGNRTAVVQPEIIHFIDSPIPCHKDIK
jgi:hypothetical protein